MESLNVIATSAISDQCMQQISGVSPKIKLTNVSDLFHAERRGDAISKGKLDALLAEVEVLFSFRLPQNVITRSPKLKWVQVMTAGVDRFLDTEMLKSSVVMTNASGIHATPIGEFVLGLMLMFVKQSALCFQLKQEKQWRRFTTSVLRSKTVGVVGLGSIGHEVARLAKAFGMRVLATRRSTKQVGQAQCVDIMLPLEQLRQLLAESDFVVLAVPLTTETAKLIGGKELRAMKPTAHLINIASGGVVDEEALVRALDEGWIAGAGLDVFTTEPLPPENRLWEFPNTILSPVVSGGMEDYVIQVTELFSENLRRYLDGKKLFNVVNKKKGY